MLQILARSRWIGREFSVTGWMEDILTQDAFWDERKRIGLARWIDGITDDNWPRIIFSERDEGWLGTLPWLPLPCCLHLSFLPPSCSLISSSLSLSLHPPFSRPLYHVSLSVCVEWHWNVRRNCVYEDSGHMKEDVNFVLLCTTLNTYKINWQKCSKSWNKCLVCLVVSVAFTLTS